MYRQCIPQQDQMHYIFDKKLLFLIILLFSFCNLILLHLRKFSFLMLSKLFLGSIIVQSHSGYSESSLATGSSPFLKIFKFNGVPALHDDSIKVAFASVVAAFCKIVLVASDLFSMPVDRMCLMEVVNIVMYSLLRS